MTYYLLLKGDTEKDVIFDTNVLGEESFDNKRKARVIRRNPYHR